MKIKVSICGVSGFTGQQLLSILSNHKKVKIDAIFGEKTIGKKLSELFPAQNYFPKIKISKFEDYNFEDCDVIFACLPHSIFNKKVDKILGPKIIDLSADFRFDDKKKFEKIYDTEYSSNMSIKKFTYGLSEINREKIRGSNYVANPGCYPTSILLPLIPILKQKNLNKIDIIADSKSGVSGAGKKVTESKQFLEIFNNFSCYKVGDHRHQPEIEQEIKFYNKSFSLILTTHLLPIQRGILSTIYLKNTNLSASSTIKVLKEFYNNSTFIKINEKNIFPKVGDFIGTNCIGISVFEDKKTNTIIILSVLDNLIKGAAGQAVQNMNIMFGFEEDTALDSINLFP